VQVTVPLSAGSSGGPIFDLSGRVVAVAAAVLTEGQALNFAIPINAAKPLLKDVGVAKPLTPPKKPGDLKGLPRRPRSPGGARAYDLWLRGRAAEFDEHYQSAIGYLQAALDKDPSMYQAHCCLGVSYLFVDRCQEALLEFRESIRLKPNDTNVLNRLALAYCSLGRYQEAIAVEQEALRLQPDDAYAHENLGSFSSLGRDQEAIAEYKEAIRLSPGNAYDHLNLGNLYDALGRRQEAIAEYKEAIRLKPEEPLAHWTLALNYSDMGLYQEAIPEYKEYFRLQPDGSSDSLSREHLGDAYRALGRYQEAIAEYEQVERILPRTYADVHYKVGLAYLALGNRGAALEEYHALEDMHESELAEKLHELLYP